jgi:hypothetical protein
MCFSGSGIRGHRRTTTSCEISAAEPHGVVLFGFGSLISFILWPASVTSGFRSRPQQEGTAPPQQIPSATATGALHAIDIHITEHIDTSVDPFAEPPP